MVPSDLHVEALGSVAQRVSVVVRVHRSSSAPWRRSTAPIRWVAPRQPSSTSCTHSTIHPRYMGYHARPYVGLCLPVLPLGPTLPAQVGTDRALAAKDHANGQLQQHINRLEVCDLIAVYLPCAARGPALRVTERIAAPPACIPDFHSARCKCVYISCPGDVQESGRYHACGAAAVQEPSPAAGGTSPEAIQPSCRSP
jgi:hypothetical protein